jgi:hypothetical protein
LLLLIGERLAACKSRSINYEKQHITIINQ